MEKFEVLGKLRDITDKIRKKHDKTKVIEDDPNSEFVKMNLPHSARKILHVLYLRGNLNQRTIAGRMNVSSQAVSEVISKLELNGLVSKSIGAQNNENIISITEKGKDLALKHDIYIRANADRVFTNFTDDEVDTFYELLSKMEI